MKKENILSHIIVIHLVIHEVLTTLLVPGAVSLINPISRYVL